MATVSTSKTISLSTPWRVTRKIEVHSINKKRTLSLSVGILDSDAILRYMKRVSPITIGLERRIRFVTNTYFPPCGKVPNNGQETAGSTSISSLATFIAPIVSINILFVVSATAF
jgi:hypothetical protein